ncbi:serine carboxypeptidase [Coniophora puteana RWD-64-598 SS2]|uniref:carboxypeptidase C n=1 Tax=Coniophora puteana (strain RWD-64-598) TaxID=741705 RepID=A0A5M3M7U4_CONPW|nr:serine carboxypeptidase [Coniophora puteana RWD-64-598 SS2]EIW75298.1 serine carboxypeptidase [Coniophora puteana RWD-64-598 SS2]
MDRVSNGSFSPVGSLEALQRDQFTVLEHPEFPEHSVRVKKSRFCDGTVDAYTGYIDVGLKHLFFYFFESRSDPDKDDVIFWTNGGPGGSSAMGLFLELGPCRMTPEGIKYHEQSWNTNANVFFIDQPVGVGFSYSDYDHVGTTEEAAVDIAAFVAIFFEHFTKFKGRPFHFSGESYAGRYLPLFASALYDQNARLAAKGMETINLDSVMIGNGMTGWYYFFPGYVDMQCTNASVFPIQSISACVRMRQMLPRCLKWFKASCLDQWDDINCSAAFSFCATELVESFSKLQRNPYDISQKCNPPEGDGTACYPMGDVAAYLSTSSVRSTLGIPDHVNFTQFSMATNQAFTISGDITRPSTVLVYAGELDLMCHWLGSEAWTLEMEWSGREEYTREGRREWAVYGRTAGWTRSARGLTYASVRGAGHLAPYDKPVETLAMVQRWLAHEEL